MVPYNNFVASSSIFESLVLKQIDLYGKTIITEVLHIDLTLLCYYNYYYNVVNYTYTMIRQPITSVTQHKYLGVQLDSKLTWNEHISAITGKANSSFGFLRRKLYNCPEQIKT